MKQQPIFISLQTQYQKLTQLLRLKGNQLSQFKHQQLLNRINRCSLQMKRLGMGMSVCLALGVGTPVMGQVSDFVKKTNAMTTSGVTYHSQFNFVDIDDDGDYDIFADSSYYTLAAVNSRKPLYYENTGTASTPIFTKRYASANPLHNVPNLSKPSFVDIDSDGDFDLFVGHTYGFKNPNTYTQGNLSYYENQGNVTNPNFVLQTGVNNPLDSVNFLGTFDSHFPAFVDIDNDGDMDFFSGKRGITNEVLFFENIGNSFSPLFIQKPSNQNPLDTVENSLATTSLIPELDIEFLDMDGDSDKDAFVITDFANPSTLYNRFRYFENKGTPSAPSFVWSLNTPVDSIGDIDSLYIIRMVDIDNDSDLDAYTRHGRGLLSVPFKDYYENQKVTSNLNNIREEDTKFYIYPNPTTGKLYFEKNTTGSLVLYNMIGQQVLNKELYEEKEINLTELKNGIYFLHIEIENMLICKKLLVQK